MRRIQENILAVPERRLLTALCTVLPKFVTPDMLTLLGFAGAVLVCASGPASQSRPAFLWLAAFGIFLNWVGDSLDGSLARFRMITRPRYGYFLDHSVDALNNLLILTGLGLTSSIRLSIALMALCGYYLMCIYVFLRRQVQNDLQLSFVYMGPTELRIIMAAMLIGIFFAPHAGMAIFGIRVTVYEMLLIFAAIAFAGLFVWFVLKTANRLKQEDVPSAATPPPA